MKHLIAKTLQINTDTATLSYTNKDSICSDVTLSGVQGFNDELTELLIFAFIDGNAEKACMVWIVDVDGDETATWLDTVVSTDTILDVWQLELIATEIRDA